jgi:PKHD-type hydroxylase|tara:strand:- start:98 stop:661 length:564 start_codon:yes stop_codon:yes gene_type:complete
MNHHFPTRTIYTVNPQLPKPILDEMLKQCKDLTYMASLTEGNTTATDKRSSQQCWLPWDTWIAGILHNNMISANNDYFHYDLDHFDSAIQVTKYEPGQEYKWHVDQLHKEELMPRKLSISLLLNEDFIGGELQLLDPTSRFTETPVTIPLTAGSMAIFPAWVVHRVKPVTSGTRYSLVAWMNGPQFR